jgi:dihydrolipoamide dehydrogenase
MIGHEVTEMIQGFVTAITLEATEEDLHGIVYAHPTMSEAMHEAALDAYGRVLHI